MKSSQVARLLVLMTFGSAANLAFAANNLPLYYAWFVTEDYSTSFIQRSFKTLADSLQDIPDFLMDVQNFTKRAHISDILAHFTRDNADEVLHCTAAYNGVYPNYTAGAEEYSNKPEVKARIETTSVLHSIGWILTPRTFGARIYLQEDQLLLWNQDDNEGNNVPSNNPKMQKECSNDEVLPVVYQDYLLKENTTEQDSDILNNFRPTSGKGSRAHLTLGCAPNTSAVNTGYDMVDIIRLEQLDSSSSVKNYTLPDNGGWLRNYGNGQWVFYPTKQWLLESTFKGYDTSSSAGSWKLNQSKTLLISSCVISLLAVFIMNSVM